MGTCTNLGELDEVQASGSSDLVLAASLGDWIEFPASAFGLWPKPKAFGDGLIRILRVLHFLKNECILGTNSRYMCNT